MSGHQRGADEHKTGKHAPSSNRRPISSNAINVPYFGYILRIEELVKCGDLDGLKRLYPMLNGEDRRHLLPGVMRLGDTSFMNYILLHSLTLGERLTDDLVELATEVGNFHVLQYVVEEYKLPITKAAFEAAADWDGVNHEALDYLLRKAHHANVRNTATVLMIDVGESYHNAIQAGDLEAVKLMLKYGALCPHDAYEYAREVAPNIAEYIPAHMTSVPTASYQ